MRADEVTASQIKNAFLVIRNQLRPIHYKMLRAHYNAPKRTMSAHEMNRIFGWRNYRYANRCYGEVGKLLGQTIGIERRSRVWVEVLCEFKRRNGQWIWKMRKPVAAALQDLGWI